MLKYELEFRFIPSLVDAFNDGKIPVQALVDIKWWEDIADKAGNGSDEFSFSDIKATPAVLADSRKVILYTFPEADMPPLAKYAVVIMEDDGKGRYITLERDIDLSTWFLGGQTGEVHLNFGSAANCQSLGDFAELIEERFLGGGGKGREKENNRKEGFIRRLFRK